MTQTANVASYTLGSTLDHDALGAFVAFLQDSRGSAVAIDAACLTQIGTLTAQVMILAGKAWAADNLPYTVDDPNGTIKKGCATLGLAGHWAGVALREGATE